MNVFAFLLADMKAYSKKYRQCSLHDVKCLRDNRRMLTQYYSKHPPTMICLASALTLRHSCQFAIADVFSSLKPPDNIAALNESSIGMECVCPPTCSELVISRRTTHSVPIIFGHLHVFRDSILQRYEVQAILSRRYKEDKLNTTTSG